MITNLLFFNFLEVNNHEFNRIWIPTNHYVRKR